MVDRVVAVFIWLAVIFPLSDGFATLMPVNVQPGLERFARAFCHASEASTRATVLVTWRKLSKLSVPPLRRKREKGAHPDGSEPQGQDRRRNWGQ